MIELSAEELLQHQENLQSGRAHRAADSRAIRNLQMTNATHFYRKLEYRNLFEYAVGYMGFSESVAGCLIAVARKALEIPELQKVLDEETLTSSRASRILSILTLENAGRLIAFAQTHSAAEIDRERARLKPSKATRDKVKFLDENHVQLTVTIDMETYEALKRAQSLEAAKAKELGSVLKIVVKTYLKHTDPVQKAERAAKKQARPEKSQKESCLNSFEKKREPLKAHEKQALTLKTKGRCQHEGADGKICGTDRFVEVHHIIRVCDGGTNDIDNLTSLCSFHHGMVHQQDLDFRPNWLKEPVAVYRH